LLLRGSGWTGTGVLSAVLAAAALRPRICDVLRRSVATSDLREPLVLKLALSSGRMSNSMSEGPVMAVGCIWAAKPTTDVIVTARERYKKLRVTMTMGSLAGSR
jgi:hypothetical protein